MPEAVFLQRLDGTEVFLGLPPVHMTPGMGETLQVRTVSDEEFSVLSDATRHDYLLWDYVYAPVSKTDIPTEVPYNILDLQKHKVRDRGLILQINYYDHYERSTDSYHIKVVEELHQYQFMPGTRQLPLQRTKLINYYLRDGSLGFTKVKTRDYVGTEPQKVHEYRKESNVINIKGILFDRFVRYYTLRLMEEREPTTEAEVNQVQGEGYQRGLLEVRKLFAMVKDPLDNYLREHEGDLLELWPTIDQEALNSPISPGIPVSIKDFVYNELDIPYA